MRPSRHGPNRFNSYQQIHETVINQFQSQGFVGSDNLEFSRSFYPEGSVLSGEIACLGEILITVGKFLEAVDDLGNDPCVQTLWYSYNVSVQGHGNLLRYDNQHPGYRYPGHGDEHHKHRFDWRLDQELPGSPFWIGVHNWPLLGEVIQEVQDWYWQNRADLPNPDKYASLGLNTRLA